MKHRLLIGIFVVALLGVATYALLPGNTKQDASDVAVSPPAAATSPDASRPEPPERTAAGAAIANGYRPADFESSDDLRDVLMAAMPAAESGDPDALDMVARVYSYCSFYSVSPERFAGHVDQTAQRVPGEAAAIRAVAEKIRGRCQYVNDGQLIPAQRVTDLINRSAAAGSVVATIQLAIRNPDAIPESDRASLISMAANSGDGALMLEATPLLGGSDMDRYAWEVIACRRGAPCGKGQTVMDWMCFSGAGCNFSSYEDAIVRGRVSQADRALFEERLRVIQSSLDKN